MAAAVGAGVASGAGVGSGVGLGGGVPVGYRQDRCGCRGLRGHRRFGADLRGRAGRLRRRARDRACAGAGTGGALWRSARASRSTRPGRLVEASRVAWVARSGARSAVRSDAQSAWRSAVALGWASALGLASESALAWGSASESVSVPRRRRRSAAGFFAGASQRAHAANYALERVQLRAPGMTPGRLTQILESRGVQGVLLASSRAARDWRRRFRCRSGGSTS